VCHGPVGLIAMQGPIRRAGIADWQTATPISHHQITARMVLSAVFAVLALMNAFVWEGRLASYRKDRAWERTDFGQPIESSWGSLDRSRYTKDAGRAYFARIASAIIIYITLGTVIWAWW
jgi:hypothetical protein